MKDSAKIVGVLTAVCVICAFLLAFVDAASRDKIKANAQAKLKAAISRLAPAADDIKVITSKDVTFYKLTDAKATVIGYAFIAEGQGYQGTIEMLTGLDISLKNLLGIEILESVETPGLGQRINDEDFRKQFMNLQVSSPVECVRNESSGAGQIKAITGATVSSRAVVNILNEEIEKIRPYIQKEK
ncbi:MAG: FMN-binding protein [Candidatus Omnitrophota bacterium]|jgi:electron transport complex protein RnfG